MRQKYQDKTTSNIKSVRMGTYLHLSAFSENLTGSCRGVFVWEGGWGRDPKFPSLFAIADL
jgi:hypothetical protein